MGLWQRGGLLVFGLLLGAAARLAAEPATAHDRPPAPPVRGVALGLFAEDPGWSYRPLLEEIAASGADHVELVIGWYQEDGLASELCLHPRYSAPDEAVIAAVAEAHALGLAVTLFPIVRLLRPREGEWRGTLSPSDRAAWWRSYRGRLLALARLARTVGAEGLSVGSELSTLDGVGDVASWQALIAEVRAAFSGQLLYSGNWDHFSEVAIYDLVDVTGLCGYFRLVAPGAAATLPALVDSWRRWRELLTAFARAQGRPILFTEVGYRSLAGAAAAPWDEGSVGKSSLEEQRRAYAAFAAVWEAAPATLFGGVYFWNWYGWGGPGSCGYTPRGKPAAVELERFFSALRRAAWERQVCE